MKADEWLRKNQQTISTNHTVEIKLQNGRMLKGMVAGYFRENIEDENAEIIKWHVVDEQDYLSMGIDAFGFLIGEMIDVKDIIMITFKEN